MDKLFDLTTLDSNYDMQEIMTHVGEVIKVIGVGGGGCNAIDNMVRSGVKNVEFICANTDAKALSRNKAHHLLQLGHGLTRGLGAGSQPEVGKKAAMEDREKIAALLKGTDMLFIASGMGGGTGTGAAPVIADIARSLNILTVGVVTKPFSYEGDKRKKIAEAGIDELKKYVDSLIVLPNEKLLSELNEEVSMRAAFAAADDVLKGAVLGITEVIKTPGVISLDFADVKTVMSGRGLAMMGSSSSNGQNRARDAAEKAIFSPLLDDVSLDGAKGVLVNISSSPGALRMKEYHEILGIIQSHVSPDADFKSGMAEIEDLDEEEIRVTVIATGLNDMRLNSTETGLFKKEDVTEEMDSQNSTDTLANDSLSDPFGSGFNKNVFFYSFIFPEKSFLIYQRTIQTPVSVTGVGLHSGCRVKLSLKPATINEGITFIRTDLPDLPSVKCEPFLVNDTRLSSTLVGENNVRVGTVEHLLSAFACFGIDNITVEISAQEVPIMDGSSNSFLYLLDQAKVIEQKVRKKYIRIKEVVEVTDSAEDKWVKISPFDGYKVKIITDFGGHPVFKKEYSTFEVDFAKHSYLDEISRARTFGFMYQVEYMRKNGLGLGGNLNNAIVLDEDSVLNIGGLRYPDEFVRHKILDAIGDLYIVGHQIIGAFEGYKSGHAINNQLLRKILNNPQSWEYITYSDEDEVPPSFHYVA